MMIINRSTTLSRRRMLRYTLLTAAAPMLLNKRTFAGRKKEIGLYIGLSPNNPAETVNKVRQLGFSFAEFYNENFDLSLAKTVKNVMNQEGLTCSGLMMLGPGDTVWDFYGGPQTIGLVPRSFRQQRVESMKRASDFCAACDIPALETHVGFIPENPNDALYDETVKALQEIVGHCLANRQTFLYHAGQETPTTMIRTIKDVGLANQGVGLDTANLIMYDKGHPVYALDVYGDFLTTINAKDGLYPTNSKDLGLEVPIGHGAVDFPRFFAKLHAIKFEGPILIERETSGPQWEEDVKAAKQYLENFWEKKT